METYQVIEILVVIIISMLSGMWVKIYKSEDKLIASIKALEAKIDKNSETLTGIKERLIAIETTIHLQEGCQLKYSNPKKAE